MTEVVFQNFITLLMVLSTCRRRSYDFELETDTNVILRLKTSFSISLRIISLKRFQTLNRAHLFDLQLFSFHSSIATSTFHFLLFLSYRFTHFQYFTSQRKLSAPLSFYLVLFVIHLFEQYLHCGIGVR